MGMGGAELRYGGSASFPAMTRSHDGEGRSGVAGGRGGGRPYLPYRQRLDEGFPPQAQLAPAHEGDVRSGFGGSEASRYAATAAAAQAEAAGQKDGSRTERLRGMRASRLAGSAAAAAAVGSGGTGGERRSFRRNQAFSSTGIAPRSLAIPQHAGLRVR